MRASERERHREGRQRDRRGATGNGELNHFQLWERLLVSCADPGQRAGWRLSRENLRLKSSKTQAWGWDAAWHPKRTRSTLVPPLILLTAVAIQEVLKIFVVVFEL